MKKINSFILIIVLLISLNTIQAQTKISLGATAGINFSSLSYDPDVTAGVTKSSRTGFQFGGLAEIGFIPMLALQIQPTFVTGAGGQISGAGGKVTYKLSYLELPILLKFNIPVAKSSFTPFLFAGPNIAFVMSSKELDEINNTPSKEIDNADFTSSVIFMLDFGAGGAYKVAPTTSVTLDVRYSLGLANLLNDKGKQNFGNNQSIKTSGLQIVAGVVFGL